MKLKVCLGILLAFGLSVVAYANTLTVPMTIVSGPNTGKNIGTVKFTDSKYGLLITPNLKDLTPGLHGFHIHQNPSCAKEGMAAGGHYDPQNTGKHLGPYNKGGHAGDLPALYVAANGTATLQLVAPRLTTSELKGHSVMIHEHGDNYSDQPQPLGGGGMRMVCGVIS